MIKHIDLVYIGMHHPPVIEKVQIKYNTDGINMNEVITVSITGFENYTIDKQQKIL